MLTVEQKHEFNNTGWLILSDVFDNYEVEMLSEAALEVLERTGPEVGRETDGSPHLCWGMPPI